MEAAALRPAKKNAGRQATLIFLDESGFSESPAVRRTWAPRGQTPVVRTRGRNWKRMSAIGALTYPLDGREPRVYVHTLMETVRTEHVVRFLEHLHRFVPGPVVLIWDRLNQHRSLAVKQWVDDHADWITLEFLPAYAPELNPVEGLWSWAKGSEMANWAARAIRSVRARLWRAMARARRRPHLLWGFLAKAGLSL